MTLLILQFTSGVLIGTIGLAWMHYFIHRFNLFNISIFWKYHKSHHQKIDPEQNNRKKYTLPMYGIISSLKYFNYKKWTVLDWSVVMLCITYPKIIFPILFSIFIAENIGYLQHTYDGHSIDFTNKFDNFIGLNCGHHSKHHGHKLKYKVGTEVIFGLFCCYMWFFFVLAMYPLLFINRKRPTIPGAYMGSFWLNIANYKAQEGYSILNLIRRMPSIFDKPIILIQYIKIIFGIKTKGNSYSHSISQIRNIYKYVKPKNNQIIRYQGKIIEGHHRFSANPNYPWKFLDIDN